LSVFAGGWTLEAAEAVCVAVGLAASEVLESLTHLVDKSLAVRMEQDGQSRYRLLETVREYAKEKLVELGEAKHLSNAHLEYFLKLAERAEPDLIGTEQAVWLKQLNQEHSNLRQALGWALQQSQAELAQRLCGALGQFWSIRGHFTEGREWLRQALKEREDVSKAARAKALRLASILAHQQGDYREARQLLEEGLVIFRELDDKQGIARTLNNMGHVADEQGDYERARRLTEEALTIFRELGDKRGVAIALYGLGNVAIQQKDYREARELYEEGLAIYRELGDRWGVAIALGNLGVGAADQGDYGGARRLFEESLGICRELGNKRGVAIALSNLGHVAVGQEDVAVARSYFEGGLHVASEIGDSSGMIHALSGLAWVFEKKGQANLAGQLQGVCYRWLQESGAALETMERTLYDKACAALKQDLGEEGYLAAFEKGKGLTLEQAIASALEQERVQPR